MRDVVLRYRGSVLGFLWTFLNPLLMMIVYTLVFSVYLRVALPHYAVFLVSGLLPWLWFGAAIGLGASSISDGRVFIGKAVFAPIILVLVPIFSNAVNYLLSVPMLLAIDALFRVPVGWPLLALPLLVAIQFMLTLGILLFVATFTVFYRDLQQLVSTILVLLFYLAPIFYPITSVPSQFRPYLFLDPMVSLELSYQKLFYYNQWPDPKLLLYAIVSAAALCYAGAAVFSRYKDAFADYA